MDQILWLTKSVRALAVQDYSNHEIVAFLESIGAAFGACQNAMTSMDETIYEVSVPTDQPQFLQQTFSVLSQFATKIRCACTQPGNSQDSAASAVSLPRAAIACLHAVEHRCRAASPATSCRTLQV